MTLVLPNVYVDLEADVMGADGQRFYRNLTGMIAMAPAVSRALNAFGMSASKLSGALRLGYAAAYAKFGVAATVAAGVIGGALAVGAFAMLWNVRMFY